jgi:hypothetical protein
VSTCADDVVLRWMLHPHVFLHWILHTRQLLHGSVSEDAFSQSHLTNPVTRPHRGATSQRAARHAGWLPLAPKPADHGFIRVAASFVACGGAAVLLVVGAVQHWSEPRQAGASGGAGHTAVPLQVQPRA